MTDESSDTDASTAPAGIGRLLVGLGIALQASEDFRDMEDTIEYAESSGVPNPELLAPAASGSMLLGGIGVALWRLPRLATTAVVTVLTVVTLTMHDFWNADEDARDDERLAFFGNITMIGGALVFLKKAFTQ